MNTRVLYVSFAIMLVIGLNRGTVGEPSLLSNWAGHLEYVGVAVEEKDYHVWGSSPIIGPCGRTHLFVARWPVSTKFVLGWHTHCEVARYVADKPEGPFEFQDVVLRGTGKDTWDRLAPHNLTIHKVGNKYVLFYIANNGTDGFPANQQIGMVMAESLEGPWRKVGNDGLILSPPSDSRVWSHRSVVGVNNPTLLQHPDGRFYLYYKAMRKGDVRRMGVAIADGIEGPYEPHQEPLTSNTTTIEDGYVFTCERKICLLTTDNEKGRGYLWQLDDGIHFGDPTVGFDSMNKYIDPEIIRNSPSYYGGAKFERPQVLVQNGQPTHLYIASGLNVNRGNGSCSYVLRIKPK